MVMSGGAVAQACSDLKERILKIAAHIMGNEPTEIVERDGVWHSTKSSAKMTLQEIAHVWYRQPQRLPSNINPSGLEVTAGYKTKVDTGTFSYACHAVVVSVDSETFEVKILDYCIVEDAGVMVNPKIVDGQILGGLAQGIGTALYEEMNFDDQGQPMASTLADYCLPGSTEVPNPKIQHLETPSPYTTFGQKGIGEGGAIGPPAAIANAVNDALKIFNAEVRDLPITPKRIWQAISEANELNGVKA